MTARGPGARRSGRRLGDVDAMDAAIMDPAAQARVICLKLLTARPRSRAELAEALHRRGIPEEIHEPVLDRLGEVGLADDAAFAESAVHSGHTYRGLGRRALSAELRRRGVPDDITREAVAAVRPEDEEQRARELVRRRLRTTVTRDDKVMRRLAGMLARKGYSEGLVLRVLREEFGPGNWSTEVELDPG
jgi:regulatory protein